MAILSRKFIVAALCALNVGALAAPAPPPIEYQVKASYLFNFIRFTAWPRDVFGSDGKFNLCVIGAERFGSALDTFTGEQVDGRELTVRRLDGIGQIRSARCHVVFVAAGTSDTVPRAQHGLLTVGETADFIKQGGIINLVDAAGRIRFQINQQAARDADLVLSSRLLDLALTYPYP